MPRRLRQTRQRYVLDLPAMNALIACPPPWEPIDPRTDEYLGNLVHANLATLLAHYAERPDQPAWPLVRYHHDPDIARACIEAHRHRLHRWIAAQPLAPWADKHRDELEALQAWAQEAMA